MLENEIGVRVTKFQRKFSGTCLFEMREIIAGKAVSQRIIWPRLNASCSARTRQQFAVTIGRHRPMRLCERLQPDREVRLDLYEASAGTFGFARCDLN